MKKLLAAFALASAAAVAGPALADVGVSIQVGEPGFYGRLDIGGYQPRLIYSQPVVVERRYRSYPPIYVRVPPGHQKNWKRYCGRYDACGRPVYFVRDEWYRDVYAPRYRQHYSHDRRDDRWDRREDRRDDRWDRRYDRRDDRRDRRDDHRGRN
jgi:hypothetical protein